MVKQTSFPFARHHSRRGFLVLLIFVIALLVIGPLFEEFTKIKMLIDIFWSAILIAAIYAVSQKKHHIVIATLLAVPMIASIWSRYFIHHPALHIVGGICGAAFFIFAIIQILIYIYSRKKVTKDLIFAAAIVYLFMALAWTFIFALVELVHPGSFKIPGLQDMSASRHFLYYSFVTITTLGYGDIVPVTNLARSLCVLEAVIGQLYLVVQVAWLVGMHVSQSMQSKISQP
jgi:hypothetical protein